MSKLDPGLLDRLTATALESVRAALDDCSGCGCASPSAIALLLRQYTATGRADLRDGAGNALARAMHEACVAQSRDGRSAWLRLFVEAAGLSEDERLSVSIDATADALAAEWPATGSVASILRTVDAALTASGAIEAASEGADLVARAVDELERIVTRGYAPGSGIVHDIGSNPTEGGTLEDHAAAASALLVAYQITGRLPYGMLADELMQFARRQWWTPSGWNAPFADACEASRVMCRLAALYRDDDYRAAAILADADYGADAERALAALAALRRSPDESAHLGLALVEFQALGQSAI
jgi:hypothetical protein